MGVTFESFIVCLLLENDQKDLTEVQTQVAEKSVGVPLVRTAEEIIKTDEEPKEHTS